MPIKFQCPNCRQGLVVKDHLAGKKGPCPKCQKVITVPAASMPSVPAAPSGDGKANGPPAAPVDLEAQAAALLSDAPAAAPTGPTSIDFNCPMCDAELHLGVELAGKKTSCPSCTRIIKVPQLHKQTPLDWRQAATGGPALARKSDQAVPEGAWGTAAASAVSREALLGAKAIAPPPPRHPLTLRQRIQFPVVVAVLLIGAGAAFWWGRGRQVQQHQQQSIDGALHFASSDAGKQMGREAQAALFTAAGEYALRSGELRCVKDARERFGKALSLLVQAPAGPERDTCLGALALAEIGLGGEGEDLEKERRLRWDEVQKTLRATLAAIQDPQGRLAALRGVAGRLARCGQGARVLPLVGQLYAAADADRGEALATAGLELFDAGDAERAGQAGAQALAPYESKKPPALRPAVVTLAMVLKRPPPAPAKTSLEEQNRLLGEVEGLARNGQWDQARTMARTDRFGPRGRFRALAAIAFAGAAVHGGNVAADAAEAMQVLETTHTTGLELGWVLLRLVQVAVDAGVPEERTQATARVIVEPALRGRAQLAVLKGHLNHDTGPAGDSLAEAIEHDSVAQFLAWMALARSNARRDGSASTPPDPSPRQAFMQIGAALGLQDRARGR